MESFDGNEPDSPLRACAVATAQTALPLALAASALFLSCGTPTSPGPDLDLPGRVEDPLAAVGAHVVPMDREVVLRDRTVVIRGGRVVEVAASGDAELPEDVTAIDARGLYLVPGLIDAHVHLRAADMDAYLAAGVTTVRNMWGTPEVEELRRQVEEGDRPGPRIVAVSPGIDGNPPARPQSRVVEDPDRAAAVVDEMTAAGWDYVKIYQNLSLAVYREVVSHARQEGIPAVGHVPTDVPLAEALRGQVSIEHLEGYDKALVGFRRTAFRSWAHVGEEDVPEMERLAGETRDARVWNCPTLLVADRVAARSLTEEEHARAVRERRRMVRSLHDAGARLLAGTDGGVPVVPPGALAEELLELRRAGLTAFEAVRTATTGAADFLGLAHEIGIVAKGMRADLVLLRDDPLAELDALSLPVAVVVGGEWFGSDRLRAAAVVRNEDGGEDR